MTSTFENKNSFWPEYKNLEKQVIDVTNHVCFCDEQVNVFSRENSNLILQIGSEIESISKELYRQYILDNKDKDDKSTGKNTGNCQQNEVDLNEVKYDFKCLKELDAKLHLTKKEVCITGANFYFRNSLHRFCPLFAVYDPCARKKNTQNKSDIKNDVDCKVDSKSVYDQCTDESANQNNSDIKNDSESLTDSKGRKKYKCKWKGAYTYLKHNNRANIDMATIGNLMSSLGALFVLNLYYRDLNNRDYKFYLNGDLFDSRVGSEIFSVNCYEVPTLIRGIEMGDHSIDGISQDELAKAIYIKKYDDESMKFMHRMCCLDYHQVLKNFETAPELQPYRDNPDSEEYKDLNEEQICYKIGGLDLVTKIFNYENTEKTIRMTLGREILLNTHSRIYDTVTYDDFLRYYKEEVKKRRIERFYPGLSSIHKP